MFRRTEVYILNVLEEWKMVNSSTNMLTHDNDNGKQSTCGYRLVSEKLVISARPSFISNHLLPILVLR